MKRAHFRVWPVLPLLALHLTCTLEGRLDRWPIVYDFVEQFPGTTAYAPPVVMDGTSAATRVELRDGWEGRWVEADGSIHTRAVGEFSWLEFFWFEPRDLRVSFRLRAQSATRITIDLNGRGRQAVVAEHGRPESELRELTFPAGLVIAGRNRLRFRYSYDPPVPPAIGDPASVAAIVGDIRIEAVERLPSVDDESGTLSIPLGRSVDYHLAAPASGVLSFDGPWVEEAADARLRIRVQLRGGPERTVLETGVPGHRHIVGLPLDAPTTIRVSFDAVRDRTRPAPEDEAVAIRVRRPVLRATSTPSRPGSRGPFRPRGHRLPNVIIYLVDTLRADRLGCYGQARNLSPHIDAFAGDGVLFRRAMAQAPWTKPSVASILTGVGPGTHGANDVRDVIPEEMTTLAELLAAAGMHTAAFLVDGNVSAEFGFRQGFADFVALPAPGRGKERRLQFSERINRRVYHWLRKQGERPFLLYVHTLDPHEPYEPPLRDRTRFASHVRDPSIGSLEAVRRLRRGAPPEETHRRDLMALYDAEVAANDRSFGAFVKSLKKLGLYDDALIIFLSDHGEGFWEHGVLGHARTLHAEALDLPLLVKFPAGTGWAGRHTDRLAQHVDIVPTILDYLGLPAPPHLEGRSLIGAVTGDTWEDVGVAYLDLLGRHQVSVVEGRWKLLRAYGAAPSLELYDRVTDPLEQVNLVAERPLLTSYLEARIKRATLAVRAREGAGVAPSPQVEENLRALGYVE
jgi:arylsulfatase A-like enzyme